MTLASNSSVELDAHRVRQIAVAAYADPRSVTKFLRGEPLRSSLALRIERVVKLLERREHWRPPVSEHGGVPDATA